MYTKEGARQYAQKVGQLPVLELSSHACLYIAPLHSRLLEGMLAEIPLCKHLTDEERGIYRVQGSKPEFRWIISDIVNHACCKFNGNEKDRVHENGAFRCSPTTVYEEQPSDDGYNSKYEPLVRHFSTDNESYHASKDHCVNGTEVFQHDPPHPPFYADVHST
jgi:hypothetical protein